ncbi:hypothetical protein EV421DRAFT_1908382 [Armillaria borealis]|uniref:Uncharacterized protein n=1 Tax=Armillaria borealis TaxID=47425 RepID=A0AA39J4A6_9AGAR|nr:hypothetical protein EV421DRAFT_1908382 [Armillaria borealis]
MAGQLQPGLGPELYAASMASLHRCIVNRSEGKAGRRRARLWKKEAKNGGFRGFNVATFEHSTFAGDIPFIPIPATATKPFNIGLEYGRRRWWEYGRALLKKVNADYAQGMHAGTGGGSPKTPGSRLTRFERLSTQLARPQRGGTGFQDVNVNELKMYRHQIQAVVLDSRKERLTKIIDCHHYSPDTPTEGRRDREGRTTRGRRNARHRFDDRRRVWRRPEFASMR